VAEEDVVRKSGTGSLNPCKLVRAIAWHMHSTGSGCTSATKHAQASDVRRLHKRSASCTK